MKKILFLLLLVLGNLSFSNYIKEGVYNGANDKKIFIKSYKSDDEIVYVLDTMNGYTFVNLFEVKDRYSKINEGEIVEFSLDNHYKDFEGEDDYIYECTLKVAFLENNKMIVDSGNRCAREDRMSSGEYIYSEKDSNIPEKYFGKWTYKTDSGYDICAYIDKNVFAHDSDNGNWVVGVKEEENGNLLLDGLELYEGRGFRRQFRYKFLPNGNVSIDVYDGNVNDKLYNSYNNLRKLKGKELSKCKTFLEN